MEKARWKRRYADAVFEPAIFYRGVARLHYSPARVVFENAVFYEYVARAVRRLLEYVPLSVSAAAERRVEAGGIAVYRQYFGPEIRRSVVGVKNFHLVAGRGVYVARPSHIQKFEGVGRIEFAERRLVVEIENIVLVQSGAQADELGEPAV